MLIAQGVAGADESRTNRLSWTIEWNGSVSCEKLALAAQGQSQPGAFSLILECVPNNHRWRGFMFRNLNDTRLDECSRLKPILILWTAQNENQFRAAVSSRACSGRAGSLAIMAKNPHVLAYWLATTDLPHLRRNSPSELRWPPRAQGDGATILDLSWPRTNRSRASSRGRLAVRCKTLSRL